MKKIVLGILICGVVAFAAVNLDTCKSCHGQNFEKKALGSSKVVSEMTQKEVSDILIGYKKGTYGRSMKTLMKSQVVKYTDEELRSTNIGKTEVIIKKKVIKKTEIKIEVNLSTCKSCHGKNFKKSALGKSKIVSKMTNLEIITALKGYKNYNPKSKDNYGGMYKTLMYEKMKVFTDKEIDSISIGKADTKVKEETKQKSKIEINTINGKKYILSLDSNKNNRYLFKSKDGKYMLISVKNGKASFVADF